jgi:hypothetical protein
MICLRLKGRNLSRAAKMRISVKGMGLKGTGMKGTGLKD